MTPTPGEVVALVRAARRVTSIRLRWPTDAHMEQPLGELAQALQAWDVDAEPKPEPLLPDYVTPLQALAREVLEETCEESASRHHADVPSVAKPLALPRDFRRQG